MRAAAADLLLVDEDDLDIIGRDLSRNSGGDGERVHVFSAWVVLRTDWGLQSGNGVCAEDEWCSDDRGRVR